MNVLIADEHVLVRQGLEALIKDFWPDAIIDCVDNAVDVIRHLYKSTDFSIILIDPLMLGEQGFDILDKVLSNRPGCYVTLLLLAVDTDILTRAYSHGIHSAICKCSETSIFHELFRAIEKQARYFPDLGTSTVTAFSPGNQEKKNALTDRQNDVLVLLLRGLSNKEIARQLKISHETVKVHMSAIMRHYNARNRTEVAVAAHHILDEAIPELH